MFNRRETIAEILRSNITKGEVIAFYNEHFINNPSRLDIQILSAFHEEENSVCEKQNLESNKWSKVTRAKVNNIDDFKKRNMMHPDYFHYN